MDIGNKEQLSISLHHVFEGLVHEIFVDFIEVERIAGTALATAILQNLKNGACLLWICKANVTTGQLACQVQDWDVDPLFNNLHQRQFAFTVLHIS